MICDDALRLIVVWIVTFQPSASVPFVPPRTFSRKTTSLVVTRARLRRQRAGPSRAPWPSRPPCRGARASTVRSTARARCSCPSAVCADSSRRSSVSSCRANAFCVSPDIDARTGSSLPTAAVSMSRICSCLALSGLRLQEFLLAGLLQRVQRSVGIAAGSQHVEDRPRVVLHAGLRESLGDGVERAEFLRRDRELLGRNGLQQSQCERGEQAEACGSCPGLLDGRHYVKRRRSAAIRSA